MMRLPISFTGALVWLLTATAAAAAEPPAPAVSPTVLSRDTYPSRATAFPDGVVGIPDLTYATYFGYRPLKLDLYLPPPAARAKGPRGVVVYVHGGGWRSGSTRWNGAFEDWPGVMASLASRGYVVAAVGYRLSGEAPFPAAVSDVKAAIRWLRANAATYNIDKNRVLAWGPSAGGQIVGIVSVSCGVAAMAPPEPGPNPGANAAESDCVQAGVAWFGSYDFATLDRPGRTANSIAVDRAYMGCAGPCSAETYKAGAAATYIDRGDPPMLLIHGDKDNNVPVGQSVAMDKALTAAGVESELLIIPGVDHNFIGTTPEATRQANHLAVRRTFDFIDSAIGDR